MSTATRAPSSRATPKAAASPQANGEGTCPHCGSDLWDNREQRRNGGKRPAWKCRNTSCDGGKPYNGQPSPWIQWDADPVPGASASGGEEMQSAAAAAAYQAPRSYRNDPNPFVAPQDDPDVPF